MKLRASVGSLGNQQVDYYAYLQTITSDNQFSYTFDGEGKAYYAKISNPISSGLTWETVTTYNIGLDMSFLRNRLSMSADYYVRKTTDMLTTSLTLPDVYGASTPKSNCADLRTNGWELSVSWNDSFKVANKPFRYGIQATLGDYQRTITKYNNPDKLISDHYVGKKMGEIWGYHVNGLFKTDLAEKVDGIVCVLTYKDVPKRRFTMAGQTYPEPSPYDRYILEDRVRFVGDPVAIVAGETEKAVDMALKRIKVTYEVLDAVLDFHTAMDNPVLVHPEDDWKSLCPVGADNKRNLCASGVDGEGDVDAVIADCGGCGLFAGYPWRV